LIDQSDFTEAEERSSSWRFSWAVIFVSTAQFLVRGLGLITIPIKTKVLGVVDYGIYSQILVTVGLIAPFAQLGLGTAMRRFLPGEKDTDKVRNDFWGVVALVLFNGLVLSAGLYFLSPYIVAHIFKVDKAVTLLQIAVLLVPVTTLNMISLQYFVTFEQSKKYMFLFTSQSVIEVGLIAYFLLGKGEGILALIIISLATTGLITVIGIFIIGRQLRPCLPRFDNIKPYLQLSFPLFLSSFGIWMIHSGDRYVIGYFRDMESVGVYSAAYAFCEVIIALAGPLSFVLLPAVSRFWDNGDVEKARNYLEYALRYFLLIGIPATFGLSVLSRDILSVLTTTDFASGWYVIPIITSSILIFQGSYFASYILILTRNTGVMLKITIFVALENLILNIILVPPLGILGAAIGTFITYITFALFIWKTSTKYLKMSLHYSPIVKSIIASLLMSAGIYFLNIGGIPGLLITVVVGLVIYSVALFGLKGISLGEIRQLLERRS